MANAGNPQNVAQAVSADKGYGMPPADKGMPWRGRPVNPRLGFDNENNYSGPQGIMGTLGSSQNPQGLGQVLRGIGKNIGQVMTPQQPSNQDPQQPNVYQQSAGAYGDALGATSNPLANGMIANADLSQYTNPYEDQVVQNTMNDLERTRLMQQNQMGASASSAGAFGGSRHGVADAETNRGFARQAADTSAQLRHAGYNQALTSAGQDVGYGLDQGRQLGSLANMGFGFGQDITSQQQQVGLQQQAMNQALIDASKAQYAGYTGSPLGSLNAPLAAIGAGGVGQQTQTQEKNAGLYDYLSLAASLKGAKT